jgi:hypothetical protein
MTRDEAIAKLRELLSPGDTVRTISRHTSRSGMSRSISPVVNGEDVSYLVAPACGLSFDRKHGGVRMGGCGMDMGFALVYNLARVLFPDGHGCIGDGGGVRSAHCPSNDHANGDRDYTPHTCGDPERQEDGELLFPLLPDATGENEHWHSDGGYALRHRWL